MSAIIQGNQLRTLLFGDVVTKTGQALPADATANLFVVTGGNVLVTSLIGEVTTVCSSTATTVSLGLTPSGSGTLEHAGIAQAGAVTSCEVGTFVMPTASGGTATALAVGTKAGSALFGPPIPFVCPPGDITWTTSANNGTGVFTWYCTYVPLDNGAYVS